jgi:hypothetical protein
MIIQYIDELKYANKRDDALNALANKESTSLN